MRRLGVFLAVLLWLALSAPVAFALPGGWTVYSAGGNNIGTPVLLGTQANGAGGAGVTLTTSNSSPAGSLIAALMTAVGTGGITGASDAVSNSYSAATSTVVTTAIGAYYSGNATALPSGDIISLGGTGTNAVFIIGASVPGVSTSSPLDNTSAGASGTSTAPSATEGTVTNANRIMFCLELSSQNGVTGDPAGFTSLATTAVTSSKFLHVAYKIITGNASAQTCTFTLGSSIAWTAGAVSFQSQ